MAEHDLSSFVARRRPARTNVDERSGRECYVDTGRPVDERLGSHVVLWIVDDPEAWATAIEAEADAEFTRWPSSARGTAEHRRAQRYQDAAKVRAAGPRRTWRSHEHSAERAAAHVADLRRSHPNPGVRYEVADITQAGACPECHEPQIKADGEWRHHTGGYPAQCRPRISDPDEGKRAAVEWEIDISQGHMICAYCDQTETWPEAILGYARLTGFHMLVIERATGTLVVLAEATLLNGELTVLPHRCQKIPDDLRAKYASQTEHRVTLAASAHPPASDMSADMSPEMSLDMSVAPAGLSPDRSTPGRRPPSTCRDTTPAPMHTVAGFACGATCRPSAPRTSANSIGPSGRHSGLGGHTTQHQEADRMAYSPHHHNSDPRGTIR